MLSLVTMKKIKLKKTQATKTCAVQDLLAPSSLRPSLRTIVPILVYNIAEAQNVKLTLAPMTCSIDWEEDRPSDAAPDKADNDHDLEVTEKEVRVDGIVLQDVSIRKLVCSSQ